MKLWAHWCVGLSLPLLKAGVTLECCWSWSVGLTGCGMPTEVGGLDGVSLWENPGAGPAVLARKFESVTLPYTSVSFSWLEKRTVPASLCFFVFPGEIL